MPQSIEWRHDGRRLIVPVRILSPYPITDLSGVDARALIDTGSTVSGIAARLARRLQLKRRGKRPVGSLRGEEQIERYLFRVAFEVGNLEGSPSFPFVFSEIEGIELVDTFSLDALIGIDILRQCNLSMKRDGSCVLAFG